MTQYLRLTKYLRIARGEVRGLSPEGDVGFVSCF